MDVVAGTTDVSLIIPLFDPTTNGPNTGLTIADLEMAHTRPGADVATAGATALGAVGTAHTDNYAIEIDATDCPGDYRFDFPDAAFAAGVSGVQLTILDGSGVVIGHMSVALATAMRGTDNANTTVPDAAGTAPTAAAIVNEWETQSQADPTGFHVNVLELNGSAIQQASGYVKVSDGTGTGQIALASGKVDVSHLAGSAIQQSGGYIYSNVFYLAGSSIQQDGGYVRVSDGTGQGQLNLTSGVIESDLIKIHGTALTETAGQLAGRFVDFFNQNIANFTVATPLVNFKANGFSTHNAGDVYTAFGTGGNLTTCATATGFSTHTAANVYTAFGTGGNLTTCATATGFSTHDAAAVKTAIEAGGSSIASILADTNELQTDDIPGTLATIAGYLDTEIAAIKAVTDAQGATGTGLSAIPWNAAWDAEVESEVNDAIDTAISELGVAAPTATPTLRTGMMLMYMALRNKLIVQTSGTDALEIHNDAGTKITSKAITDDGSDYSEAKTA